jgi:hypothetical protein
MLSNNINILNAKAEFANLVFISLQNSFTFLECVSVSQQKNAKEIDCFVHSVSPIKTGGDKKYRFFDCSLQTEDKVIRAVCFSPERRQKFDNYAQSKSPVKIKKFGENNRYGTTNVIIERHTIVETPPSISFERRELSQDTMTISSLSDISSGQQVTIKGHLTDLFGSKKFMSKSGQALIKQDGLVSDPTGTIKVTFWGNFIDEAQKGKTYNFKQFVYKNDNYGIYLTTSTSVSILEEGEPLQQPLAKPEIDSKILANKEMIVSLLGVSSVIQYLCCSLCNRKIDSDDNSKIAICSNPKCNLTQKVSHCPKQWVVKLYVQNNDNPNHKFHVAAFHSIVQQLAAQCFTDDPLDLMSPQQLTNHLLADIDQLKITYDTVQKKIVELL